MSKNKKRQRRRTSLASKERPEIETAIDIALDETIDDRRPLEVRASGLPFCPRRYAIDRLIGTPVEKLGYFGQVIMDEGTALHAVTQRYLAVSGMLWGDWHCPSCNLYQRRKMGPVFCSECSKPMVYEELVLEHPCGLTGHCDGVLPKYRAVLEIKGTDWSALSRMTAPIWYHVYQASCYVFMANENYGLNLDKIAFLYVDRGRPSNRKMFIKKPLKNIYRMTIEDIEAAKQAVSLCIIPQERMCEDLREGRQNYCNYADICFSSDHLHATGGVEP